MATTHASYPAPGRGAWRLAGGLLPVRPTLAAWSSRVGYYRLNADTEAPVGSGWLSGHDETHDAQAVMLGVAAIQHLVSVSADGWFGPDTAAGVLAAQKALFIEADAIIGPASMKALLTPAITVAAGAYAVPLPILGGILVNESTLDPGAVGVNGQDHGISQINLGAHPEVTLAQAMDPLFAIRFTAAELAGNHAAWVNHTSADAWDVAIAAHNSPKLAREWAISGVPPVVAGRLFQIAEYVRKVRAAW